MDKVYVMLFNAICPAARLVDVSVSLKLYQIIFVPEICTFSISPHVTSESGSDKYLTSDSLP